MEPARQDLAMAAARVAVRRDFAGEPPFQEVTEEEVVGVMEAWVT